MRRPRTGSLVLLSVVALVGLVTWQRLLLPFGWLALVAVFPALWVAIDARRTRPQDYTVGLSYPPLTLFFLVLLSMVVVLPWYLSVRELIRSGRALRRPSAARLA